MREPRVESETPEEGDLAEPFDSDVATTSASGGANKFRNEI